MAMEPPTSTRRAPFAWLAPPKCAPRVPIMTSMTAVTIHTQAMRCCQFAMKAPASSGTTAPMLKDSPDVQQACVNKQP